MIPLKEQGEFIAADAGDAVFKAQDMLLNVPAMVRKDHVSYVKTKSLIDLFKMIKVQAQDRELCVRSTELLQ